MKILYASAEVAPFSKAGGLADVMGSLPKELEKYKDCEIAIFTPLHGCIDKEKYNIKKYENSDLWLGFGNNQHKFELFITKLPDTKINVFFIKNDWYFSCFKEIYPKWLDPQYEHERYIAFSLAVLEYAKLLNFRADVIHSNDWHTAMIPLYIKANYKFDEFWSKTKNVFSIHNLAYQGVWFENMVDFANMRKDIVYNEWGCEHWGRVNWMKGALNYSDKIIVVSPTYAKEILTSEYGEGMDYTLRGHTGKIAGILNGIDYSVFNPKTDKHLIKNYDIKSVKNKEENKKAVCKFFGLKYDPQRALIVMVSRLTSQKGLDLVRDMQYKLQELNADFIFLGSGDKNYENLLIWLSNNTPNIRSFVGYKNDLANMLYAGGDFFLMPSKYEPCGLSQLIALRYGTLPIVRATGGLEDTIVGYPLDNSTGFKFWEFNGYCMVDAINCALNVYKDKYTFNAMRKSAMEANFTWESSVKKYYNIYKNLIENV